MKKKINLEIRRNGEGQLFAVMSRDEASGYRIAGPKAWGGSEDVASLTINPSDLITFIREYVPELIPEIIKE